MGKRQHNSRSPRPCKISRVENARYIWIKLDRGIWWPGYVVNGKGTFLDEEDEVGIKLTKSNHCDLSEKEDASKIDKALGKLTGDLRQKFQNDLHRIQKLWMEQTKIALDQTEGKSQEDPAVVEGEPDSDTPDQKMEKEETELLDFSEIAGPLFGQISPSDELVQVSHSDESDSEMSDIIPEAVLKALNFANRDDWVDKDGSLVGADEDQEYGDGGDSGGDQIGEVHAGDDQVDGGGGNKVDIGGDQVDEVHGGDNQVDGAGGDKVDIGGDQVDEVHVGNDQVNGGGGKVDIGGDQVDEVRGGDDQVNGGGGDQVDEVLVGDDQLDGGGGDKMDIGGDQVDKVHVHADDDQVDGGGRDSGGDQVGEVHVGDDQVNGGGGDQVDIGGDQVDEVHAGDDQVGGAGGDKVDIGGAQVVEVHGGDDQVNGGGGDQVDEVLVGDDQLDGGGGDKMDIGGDQVDKVHVHVDDDQVDGGVGDSGGDQVGEVHVGDDQVNGGGGDQVDIGGDQVDEVNAGDDQVGGAGGDKVDVGGDQVSEVHVGGEQVNGGGGDQGDFSGDHVDEVLVGDDKLDGGGCDQGDFSGDQVDEVLGAGQVDGDGDEQVHQKESNIQRAIDNENIYIARILQSTAESNQPRKKLNRVYNVRHSCYICGKMFVHIVQHFRQRHRKDLSLDNQDVNELRIRGDNIHNREVISSGKGELILARRPKGPFKTTDFGPCPYCLEWMHLNTLQLHQKNCKKCRTDTVQVESSVSEAETHLPVPKRSIQMMSDVVSGRIQGNPSNKLVKEVFSIMTRDAVTEVAKNDELIVELGESWLRRSIGNAKAKYYSSQHMRLMAKFLLQLRENDSSETQNSSKMQKQGSESHSLWDYITPAKFNSIVKAALQVALPYMDDIEELKAPSNAIKIKYDLKRVVEFKWSTIHTRTTENADSQGGPTAKDEADKCDIFCRLLEIHWSERVTKLARTTLALRSFTKGIEIPSPEDIETANKYLDEQLSEVDLEIISLGTYRRVVKLVQTKLLMFNKRRSGEIDQMTLKQYAGRKKKLEDVDQSLVGELSELERRLLETHDLMVVRGKRTRPVPVLIPTIVQQGLKYIADMKIREEIGVSQRKWLFASAGTCSIRSYDSLSAITSECNLKAPSRITSVTLRKYMATLTQVMNLNDTEVQWACDHLGHTKGVHLGHYRQMSGFIERVKMAKLILVQDMNLAGSLKGKKLEDKQVDELITKKLGSEIEEFTSDENFAENDMPEGEDALNFPDHQDENLDLNIMHACEEEESDKDKKRKSTNRKRFSPEEMKELEHYFSECLKTKTCPSRKDCLKAISDSKSKGGALANRYWHNIVKKISNLNKK